MLKRAKTPKTVKQAVKTVKSRPVLNDKEIAVLTSRFNAPLWDQTADADNAAEEMAREPKKKRAI